MRPSSSRKPQELANSSHGIPTLRNVDFFALYLVPLALHLTNVLGSKEQGRQEVPKGLGANPRSRRSLRSGSQNAKRQRGSVSWPACQRNSRPWSPSSGQRG